MNDKRIFNQTDTAEFFGNNRRTIYEWRKKGFGPKFVKGPNGRYITTRANCEKFLAELAD